MKIKIVGLLLFTVTSQLFGQDNDDGCRDVLSYSARNYTTESTDIGVALKVYDNYCENDQSKSGNQTSVGLEAVIKAVPVKFNLGTGSTDERTKYFCKTFDSDYKKNESYYRSISQVSDESTAAWLSCKTLASKGVSFRPKIAKTLVVLEIAKTNAEVTRVDGITYDSTALKCTAPNSDATKSTIPVDANTRKTLTGEYWAVTCVRQPQKQGDDTVYPNVDVAITTTKGSLLIPVSADAKHPYQWSSELERELANEATERTMIEDQVLGLQSRLKVLQDGLSKGGAAGPQKDGRLNAGTDCPQGSYMVGLWHRLDGGGPHGITSWIEAKCAPLGIPAQ